MLTLRRHQVILAALVHFIHFVNGNTAIITDTEPKCKFASNRSVDCSNNMLTAIPKIDNMTESLNLSLNAIEEIDDYALRSDHLRILDLSHNQLSNITARNLDGLRVLEVLILASNKLTFLDPSTFELLINLKRLDLRGNFIELPESESGFLVHRTLEVLNLDNCNLAKIPEASFIKMPQLNTITLSANSFSENIDVSAFESLKDTLITLRISNLSESTTYFLCEKLSGIDTIQFDGFNVSCVILSGDDSSFQDGVLTEPIEEPRIDSVISPPITTRKTTKAPSKLTHSSTEFSKEFAVTSTTSTGSPHLDVNETSNESSTNKTKIDTETASIDIENETIKYILIGIFCATVTGIFIGLICRLDVCHVKTKMCRNKTKNRRGSIEAVNTFEEIPLNVVNGTGKK